MIKIVLNKAKYFIALLALAFASVFFVTSAFAQTSTPDPSAPPAVETPSEIAQRLGISFPIADLGDCADVGSCMKYCEDPVNFLECEDYAKEKGFYKPEPIVVSSDPIWEKAKEDLGCEAVQACVDFCSQEGNYSKCDEFARKNQLEGGYTDNPDKAEYLEIAQETLGCDSLEGCQSVCDDAANQEKCTDFANLVGLFGGETQEGPGGCISDGTCESYCSDPNSFEECKKFDNGFTGPNGCNSPAACRTHCEANPDDCRSYSPGSNGAYVPITCPDGESFGPGGVCTAENRMQEAGDCGQSGKFWDGDSCNDDPPAGVVAGRNSGYFQPRSDMGGCRTPGECYDYCKENAGECGGFNADLSRPTDKYQPYIYYTPGTDVKFDPMQDFGGCDSPGKCYDYCTENEGKCQGFDSKAPRPIDTYVPGTYYTPPTNDRYFTPSHLNYYVTPVYFTPPAGSNYSTPSYYTPGSYYTPSYYTPPSGSNYVTPNYYTPGSNYITPTGQYPTPNYPTPNYYTPPIGSSYTTPTYYTPPTYSTPYYYTPSGGYTTPTYNTPPPYQTPTYYTPCNGVNCGVYSTPTYFTPSGSYTTPNYPTPSYSSPTYYYPSPTGGYSYPSPSGSGGYYYPTPSGGSYGTPTYNTPSGYSYPSPSGTGGGYYPYPTPGGSSGGYYYPTPSGGVYGTPTGYAYPSPGYYSYPSPSGTGYSTPYTYPTPGASYAYPTPNNAGAAYYTPYSSPSGSYTYPSPSYVYPSPSGSGSSYYTPNSSYTYPSPTDGYSTPSSSNPYSTPSYDTPTYNTPSYETPSYGTPSTSGGSVAGASTNPVETVWNWLTGLF